jgi:hypothetical protein
VNVETPINMLHKSLRIPTMYASRCGIATNKIATFFPDSVAEVDRWQTGPLPNICNTPEQEESLDLAIMRLGVRLVKQIDLEWVLSWRG